MTSKLKAATTALLASLCLSAAGVERAAARDSKPEAPPPLPGAGELLDRARASARKMPSAIGRAVPARRGPRKGPAHQYRCRAYLAGYRPLGAGNPAPFETFDLVIDAETAVVTAARRGGSPRAYAGKFDPSYRPRKNLSFIRFSGFMGLNGPKVHLLVERRMMSGEAGKVKMEWAGFDDTDAQFSRCEVKK